MKKSKSKLKVNGVSGISYKRLKKFDRVFPGIYNVNFLGNGGENSVTIIYIPFIQFFARDLETRLGSGIRQNFRPSVNRLI